MNPLEKIFTFDLSLGGAASTKQNKYLCLSDLIDRDFLVELAQEKETLANAHG
jgi:hypothetical protein